jgi:ABC-type transporter MlaC component
MMVRRSLGLALATVCIFASAQGAWAATAAEQLKSAIDRVLATIDNPALKDDKVVERRAAVRTIANEIFDFREVARRSLGRYWQPLSEAQRTEFVGLFGDLLERSYVFQNRALQRRTDHVQRRARGRRPRHRQHQDHYQERHRGASGLPPLQARRQMDDL